MYVFLCSKLTIMISSWKIRNFKSIREETELELAPLTIFAGANSSGKSTFIQSMLVIAQTLARKIGSQSVVLNGTLTSLGQFRTLKSDFGDSDAIFIGGTCIPRRGIEVDDFRPYRTFRHIGRVRSERRIEAVTFQVSFDDKGSDAMHELSQIQPQLRSTSLSCNTENTGTKGSAQMTVTRSQDRELSDVETMERRAHYKVELDESSLKEVKEEFLSAKISHCERRHFLPRHLVCNIDPAVEEADEIVGALYSKEYFSHGFYISTNHSELPEEVVRLVNEQLAEIVDLETLISKATPTKARGSGGAKITLRRYVRALATLSPTDREKLSKSLENPPSKRTILTEAVLKAIRQSRQSSGQSDSDAAKSVGLPNLLDAASDYLDDYFALSVKYLGPLRDTPKLVYPRPSVADPNDIGLRGEHTAFILEIHKNKKISYIESSNFNCPEIKKKTTRSTLTAAVQDWAEYLGLATSVSSQDRGQLGYQITVEDTVGAAHDLTSVGVGVSQVLPILVMCLLAKENSTLIIEQPELHLHPKVQSLLSDFFISMTLCNKQCIIETHSECFVERIRYRIAAAAHKSELHDLTKVYFVEKSEHTCTSNFSDVEINEYGAILEWPKGFFDEGPTQTGNLLNAAAKKRERKLNEESK